MRTRLIAVALAFLACPVRAQEDPLAQADRLWNQRAEGAQGGTAAPGPIDAVVEACRKALAASPGSLDARWRLMRALYYKGEYATPDIEKKKAVFAEGRDIGEQAFADIQKSLGTKDGPVALAPRLKGKPDALACLYWAAVDWGKWALVFGKSAAVKQGAAAKIRDYATAVIAIDPSFEGGGGYRVLGRLHHQTPSVPFFTGWASRSEALKDLRLAVERAPGDFINRLYLAEAMWDYEKAKRQEARAILQGLLKETPSPLLSVEETKVQEEAKSDLSAWR